MKLPLVTPLKSRNGTSNKDGRLTNVLAEQRPTGELVAQVRPGLVSVANTTGQGNGLVDFNGQLISVYGSSVAIPANSSTGIQYETFGVIQNVSDLLFYIGNDGDFVYFRIDNDVYKTSNGTTYEIVGTIPSIYDAPQPGCFYHEPSGLWFSTDYWYDPVLEETVQRFLSSSNLLTWNVMSTNEQSSYGVFFYLGNEIYSCLNGLPDAPIFWKSADSGVTWSLVSTDITAPLVFTSAFSVNGSAYLADDSTITTMVKTTNGTNYLEVSRPYVGTLVDKITSVSYYQNKYYVRVFSIDLGSIYSISDYSTNEITDSSLYEEIDIFTAYATPFQPLSSLSSLSSGIMIGLSDGNGTLGNIPIDTQIFSFSAGLDSIGTVTDSFFDFVQSTT